MMLLPPLMHRAICTLLSAAMALAPLPALADVPGWAVPVDGAIPQALPARVDPTGLPDIGAAAERAADLFDAFGQSEPPLEERVLSLELDPKAAFALIRDGVQSQLYGGRLRNAEQVFWAGAGNAYDKAAALAELLTRMGYDTRLVVGSAPSPLPMTGCTGQFDQNAWHLTGLGASVLARIEARALASYAALHPLLAPTDTPLPDAGPHIWLQMRDGAGWVDLDPWLPGTEWGAHPAGDGVPLVDLPQAQAVTLTVSVEKLRDGQLQRDDVLSRRFEMPEADGWMVMLTFGPKTSGMGGTMAQVMAEIAGGTGELVASLMVNDQVDTSAPFAGPGTGAAEGGFLAEPGEAVTTAVFLTLTSTAPGAPDRSETRTVIDLVPVAMRSAGVVDPAGLLPAARSEHMALALQGMRQIILSNGGTSRRLIAANKVMQMLDAPAVLTRAVEGNSDPWDAIWTSYLEASRVMLAAETLMRAKPDHRGACLGIDRPRALLWGMVPQAEGGFLRFLDWTLDDVAVTGGDAAAQAEQRLWHGTVQAAVEKEALYYLTQAPADALALETGPMQGFADLPGAVQDQSLGYATVTGPGVPPLMWWRVDPATGRADARLADLGNGIYDPTYLRPGARAVQSGAPRVTDISRSVAQMERDAILRQRIGGERFAEVMRARRASDAAKAAAERQKAALNEYLLLLKVFTGIAVAVGGMIAVHEAYAVMTADEVVAGAGAEP